jgi:protein TonB
MLGYVESRPVIAARRSSPNAMLVIILAHVTVIAAVMSAKMDLPARIKEGPLVIRLLPETPPPPPNPADPVTPRHLVRPEMSQTPQIAPIPPADNEAIDPLPMPGGGLVGPATDPGPRIDPVPTPTPVRTAARLLTSSADLKPPYPPSKLLTEEEADLRLKLTIDANGRVVAVEPVGRADPTFLAAARRHLLARWRFSPASEDGRPIVSTTVITLRFRLD